MSNIPPKLNNALIDLARISAARDLKDGGTKHSVDSLMLLQWVFNVRAEHHEHGKLGVNRETLAVTCPIHGTIECPVDI